MGEEVCPSHTLFWECLWAISSNLAQMSIQSQEQVKVVPIWHNRSLRISDELIQFCCSTVKVTVTSCICVSHSCQHFNSKNTLGECHNIWHKYLLGSMQELKTKI